MNATLSFLLSAVYDATRVDHPAHLADLRKSSLSDATIRTQKITDVPPDMIDQLLGFPASKVTSFMAVDSLSLYESSFRLSSAVPGRGVKQGEPRGRGRGRRGAGARASRSSRPG